MRTIDRPGKFEGEPVITPALYDYAQCGVDDECGDIQECGFYAWRLNGFDPKDFCPNARELHGLTDEDCQEVTKWYGFILIENSQGFVSLHSFKTKRELATQWKALVAQATANEEES